MKNDAEMPPEIDLDVTSTQALPPPDLSPPPPQVRSPLDSGPLPANDEARVRLHTGGEGGGLATGGGVPIGTRLIAAVIDSVVSSCVLTGLVLVLPGFASKAAYLVAIGYLVARDSLPFLGGQSIGKKVMKIRAVTLDGKSLVNNWEAALIRNGVLIIPMFGLVELVILLTREDKPERGRRLGDEWAKTKVIFEQASPVIDEHSESPSQPTDAISR